MFWRPCNPTSIVNPRCSMVRMFALIKILAVEKGGAKSSCYLANQRSLVHSILGPSRGGATTKIHCLVDGLGNPLAFQLTRGDVNDITAAPAMLAKARAKYFIADKAYDSDAFIDAIKSKDMIAVIPSRSNRIEPRPLNKHQYKERHLVENCFAKLKQFRRVASRYEKTARNYLSVVVLAAIRIWLE
jgi:transposase